MKKKRRLLVIAGMVCMVAAMLSGCKKVTALSLVTDAAKNVKEIDSFKGTMDMNMEMGLAQSGISMGINVNMSMDMEATKDPEMYYMKGNMGMDLLNISVDLEAYGETKDDETNVYVNIGDEWQKQTADIGEEDTMGNLINLDAFVQGKELKLAEKTEKLNGKEVYVITTTLDGDDFNDSMESISGLMDEELMGSIDFSDVTADVTLKIFKDSKLPAFIGMTLNGTNATVMEEDGTEMQLKELSYEITIGEYDTVDEIVIPDEALQAAEADGSESLLGEAVEEPDSNDEDYELVQDENGNYLLTDYMKSNQIAIATPAGFEITEYADATFLDFDSTSSNDDIYAGLYYTLDQLADYWTEDDLMESFTSMSDYYTEEDGYNNVTMSDVKTIKAGNRDVKYLCISYSYSDSFWENDYFAWTVLDNGYVVECYLSETAYVEGLSILNEDSIKAAFEAIQ